jgi:predicted RNase H-like HicB family nuclease
MLNLTYLAILEPGEDGSYGISFPDLPGCFSFCDSLAEAAPMAAEAASLHVYGMEQDGETIPEPSATLSEEETSGMLVMPVTIHPDLYRMKRDNERVKTNITLPAWLKRMAEEQKVNYSRLLETALMDYLQIPKASRIRKE